VSSRASRIILLCEDEAHQRLAVAYMNRCGIHRRDVIDVVASRQKQGGNVGWVLDEFSRQLQACRQRHKAKANTLLVVVVDADTYTVDERRREFNDRLKQARQDELRADDPVALLVPRRHVETWIRSLLGRSVTEDEDCKGSSKPSKEDIRQAADTLHEWARENATPGATCVPSLSAAFPEWRKIRQAGGT
jgi:hypothetical protein